jgi:hypothetical protein
VPARDLDEIGVDVHAEQPDRCTERREAWQGDTPSATDFKHAAAEGNRQ